MSNHHAIATVTAVLRALLTRELGDAVGADGVTAKPIDQARPDEAKNQINLFLYHTAINAAWRNRDMPDRVQPGELGRPALPLDLHYLVTAYGKDSEEVEAHRILGRALRVLHDAPILSRKLVRDLLPNDDPSDLDQQVERVRITFEPLGVEEMFKIWSTFQTNFRLSAALRVGVVLLESERPARSSLPVLTRGKDDDGVASQASVLPPFPTVLAARLPLGQTAVRVGEVVKLEGHHLDGAGIRVRLDHPALDSPLDLAPTEFGEAHVSARIQAGDPADLVPGIYSVRVVFLDPENKLRQESNALALALAPTPANVSYIESPGEGRRGFLELESGPPIGARQRVSILMAGLELRAMRHSPAGVYRAPVPETVAGGTHRFRLRVDGVDSLIVIDRTARPPVFDPAQTVILP